MEEEHDSTAAQRVEIADGIVMEPRSDDWAQFPFFDSVHIGVGGQRHDLNGQTGFFRYKRTMERVIRHFMNQPRDLPLRFLFAPCSIGCEPYSFAAMAAKAGLFARHPRLQLDALDISPAFIAFAREGRYPLSMLRSLPIDDILMLIPEHCSLHRTFGQACEDARAIVPIDEKIRARVRFFDAQPFESFAPVAPYDFVMSCNFLMYVPEGEIGFIAGRLADVSGGLMATTYTAATRDGYSLPYEVPNARRALAQAGFVEVDPANLAPRIPRKTPKALSRSYYHVCRLRHGIESVLLHSSGQKPLYRDGGADRLRHWSRQQACRIFG